MNPRRYNAWRFSYPYEKAADNVEVFDEPVGLSVAPTGGIEMIDEQASVRQSILLLLSTVPGERVMRPDYGCELHRLIFSPNDNTTAGLAIHYVRQALARWEPRAQIIHLDAGPNPTNPDRLEILLQYSMRRTQTTDELSFSFDLAGDAS